MEYFSNDLFKEKSKVTYVYVTGKIPTAYPRDDYKSSLITYKGYIEIPYNYNDFILFNKNQRIAICQSVFCKNGICIHFTNDPDPDKFFTEE